MEILISHSAVSESLFSPRILCFCQKLEEDFHTSLSLISKYAYECFPVSFSPLCILRSSLRLVKYVKQDNFPEHFFASFLCRDEAFKLVNDGWLNHSNGAKGATE
ncbi:hypothetical protein F2P56_011541 [Juglans regia]|uniref:Uncharacterized protein LOC108985917 n=2 Tax=Juglans regia TaxID=51240 RepID=A0A2I4E3G4_JUGRE|nr:uncharacterized protein LOC108985917 [Juglans regia]XP_018813933.1 uncharacterized protein LOC108985917 [Juglans regia]XP_035545812.1 uncharacterized protein LOC108985917 [Juglans regia]KAF5471069.1 hypothetical protein F2P56_011541 [Juglans regia]